MHNVESRWVNLLLKMADHDVPTTEALPSQNRMTQIREMLSTAVRMRRTDSSGDLMPNVSSACCFRHILHRFSKHNVTMVMMVVADAGEGGGGCKFP